MADIASLPMYDHHPGNTDALWAALADCFAQQGIAPATFLRPDDLLQHWQRDDLLLSQTCGYPLVALLPEVQLVGCFLSSAPGCAQMHYRSLLVVREQDQALSLCDFRGRRALANSADSHSGYNALRYVVAPFAQQGRFFSSLTFSGGHRQSLAALQNSEADIAAIDCITWALLARHHPHLLTGLSVIGETPLAPALPLITSASTSPETLRGLRAGLHAFVDDPAQQPLRDAHFIRGFHEATREDYQPVLAWEEEARRLGVTAL